MQVRGQTPSPWDLSTAPSCVDIAPPALCDVSSLGIGGTPVFLARPSTPTELEESIEWARLPGSPGFSILGGMTNVVIADHLDEGVVSVANEELSVETIEADHSAGEVQQFVEITIGAGRPLKDLVTTGIDNDALGLAALSGIPGSVGGAVVQNAGAYDYELSHFSPTATVFSAAPICSWIQQDAMDLNLGYRWSRLQADGSKDIVWSLTVRVPCAPAIRVSESWKPSLLDELAKRGHPVGDVISHSEHAAAVLEVRRAWGTSPAEGAAPSRTVGSFFKNRARSVDAIDELTTVVAAKLIQEAGFRPGHRFDAAGRVRLSERHVLVIEAFDGATAMDIVQAATEVRATVARVHGVILEPEARLVGGPTWEPTFADR